MIFSPFFFSDFEFFVESWQKSLGSAPKNRVGRETGNKPIFFFGLRFWPTIPINYQRFVELSTSFITPPRNRGGVIFPMQFVSVCLSVCVCVFVSDSACEQNSSRTDAPIWTLFWLNGCLSHWLKADWNCWPWVKGQGHSDVISILSS